MALSRGAQPDHRPLPPEGARATCNAPVGGADDGRWLEELLPSPDAGPDAIYARTVLLDALETALDELPAAQREVFLAHEVDGRSFKAIAADTGINVNTLLSRKHYAVLHLRERLQRLSMNSRTMRNQP